MREWLARAARSKPALLGLVGVLAAGGTILAVQAGDDEKSVGVAADAGGPPDLDAVAPTAEDAMATALWVARLGNAAEAPPGEECRQVTVLEAREAVEANPDPYAPTFDWMTEAPDDLKVWACPLLFPPNGRGLGFVKAEATEFDIARSTLGGYQFDPDDTEADPSDGDELPPLNEVQSPPTSVQL